MELTQQDIQKIVDWINSRSPKLRCFCCGNQEMTLLRPMAAMTSMYDTHTGRIHYMDGYPMIGVACSNCAHIVWFSAPLMGLKPELAVAKQQEQNAPSSGKELPADQSGG